MNIRWLTLLALCVAPALFAAERATRVPGPGIAIADKDRAELQAGADALAREISSLPQAVEKKEFLFFLPDVQVFHKAVDWALRYDEFYRSNDVGIARTLLKQGMERAKNLRGSRAPWLSATGLVVRGYTSKIDGSVQPYGLVVGANYHRSGTNRLRLEVWLHGRDDKLTELKFISDREKSYGEFSPADAIVLHVYGRYCNAFKFAGETDVFEAMENFLTSNGTPRPRVVLRGFSMGGAGVWHLAAHHPDVWAVAAPGAGFAETAEYQKLGANRSKFPAWEQKLWQLYDATDYAANFFNLPVVAYNGTDDPQRQAADVMEKAMRAEGLKLTRIWGTNVAHKYTPEGKKEVSRFVEQALTGTEAPGEVHFTTRTLRYNSFSGGKILALREHWRRADLQLKEPDRKPGAVDEGEARVQTKNVAAFALERTGRSRNFVIDGQKMKAVGGYVPSVSGIGWVTFQRAADGRWSATNTIFSLPPITGKSPGLQGPIDDAFMDSFLVVRPTGKPLNAKVGAWAAVEMARATNEWRAQFRGDARVKDDSEVTRRDVEENNLILWGDPSSNRLLAEIADKLPIRWDADNLRVGKKTFPSATHVPVMIFPNPLNPKKYIVLNSGFTFAAAGSGSNAQQTPKLPDFAVFDLDAPAASRVVLADFFDEQWRLPGAAR